jgi:hypothetical protein|tara:strand:+ start:79 stop:327 length:249 start_codon:yes stop_codon:yes gene_type:complete
MFPLLIAACLNFSDFDKNLRSSGYQAIWRGLNKTQDTVNIIYQNEQSKWVVIAVSPNGTACERASGNVSEIIIQKIGADIHG